jgi:hypothetical protein
MKPLTLENIKNTMPRSENSLNELRRSTITSETSKLISNNSIKLIKITRDTLTTFRPKRCNKHLRPLKAELTVSKVRERLSNRDKVKPRLPRDSMSNTTQLLRLTDHQTGLKNLLSDTRRHSMISKEKSRSSREMSKRLKR